MNPPQRFSRITLELSLKPFRDLSEEGINTTCRKIWRNWSHLLGRTDEIALLLWVGSGDEVLTWSGNEEDLVPWAHQIGFNNLHRDGAYDPGNEHYRYNAPQPYCTSPPTLRYRDLKRIIAALRASGNHATGKVPLIGIAVDPGPEFADSPWRYEQHRELLQVKQPGLPYPMHFITHQAALQKDPGPYAGFPEGIPPETPFGTFLGRQFEAARLRLGLDFLWLSNGLGYSHHPWIFQGALFDGHCFYPDRAQGERSLANRFWSDLRKETKAPIEVRGTNFSVGMDLATDGCSHLDITDIGKLVRPPCNPPWGSRALGLEMTAYLSRLCIAPSGRIPFRFYLNDPWFAVTSWYDYYAQEPFDIAVPMAAARLNHDGTLSIPTDLNLLSIDTSWGELLEDEAAEFTPHMLQALDTRADQPGPLIWVYPLREYHQLLASDPARLSHVFAHDWFVARVIDAGLPVNTVCDSETFTLLAQQGRLPEAVYLIPAPVDPDWSYSDAIVSCARNGGKVLLYGTTAHCPAALRNMMCIQHATSLEGLLQLTANATSDTFEKTIPPSETVDPALADVGMDRHNLPAQQRPTNTFRHRPLISGGGIVEVCEHPNDVRATASRNGEERTFALLRREPEWKGGAIAWHRGTVDFDPELETLEPVWDSASGPLQQADLARMLLAELGWIIRQERYHPNTPPAHLFIKRNRNAWYFVGHKRDTSVRFAVAGPDGAPAYEQCETRIRNGLALESFGKSFHKMTRVFVRMPDGVVSVKRLTVPSGKHAHFCIAGLVDADVTLYPDTSATPLEQVRVRSSLRHGDLHVATDPVRQTLKLRGYTGALYVCW